MECCSGPGGDLNADRKELNSVAEINKMEIKVGITRGGHGVTIRATPRRSRRSRCPSARR
jgi:hypothetical protein